MSSFIRSALLRQGALRRPLASVPRRSFASHRPQDPPSKMQGIGGLPIMLGAVAVVIPGGLYLLSSGHDNVAHNDHNAQKGLHTKHTSIEDNNRAAGRLGGKLQGIEDVVTTKHEDVDSDLPHDALNHPVNLEKIEKTQQLKPPTKRTDPIKSVRPQ